MVKAQANQSSKVALLEPPLERRYNCAKKLECLQTGAAAYDANPITAGERVSKKKIAKIIIPDARRTLVTRMAYLKSAMTPGDVRRQGLNILSIAKSLETGKHHKR